MSIEEERQIFRAQLVEHLGSSQVNAALGASNGPIVMENGFRWGLFNLDFSLDRVGAHVEAGQPLALVTSAILPPREVLNLALVFRGEAFERLGDRLEDIRQEPRSSGARAGQPKAKANKVRVYLHRSGVYLRQDVDPSTIDSADPLNGPPIMPSEAFFADVRRDDDVSPIMWTWLGYLGGILELLPSPCRLLRLRPA